MGAGLVLGLPGDNEAAAGEPGGRRPELVAGGKGVDLELARPDADADGGVVELQGLDAGDRVGAVGAADQDAGTGVGNGVVGEVAGEDGDIGAAAAVDEVVAGAAGQGVVALGTEQLVVAELAVKGVVAALAFEGVGVAVSGDHVVEVGAVDLLDIDERIGAAEAIVGGRADRKVDVDGGGAVEVVDFVDAGDAVEGVVAGVAEQRVVSEAADEGLAVGIVGAGDHRVLGAPRDVEGAGGPEGVEDAVVVVVEAHEGERAGQVVLDRNGGVDKGLQGVVKDLASNRQVAAGEVDDGAVELEVEAGAEL